MPGVNKNRSLLDFMYEAYGSRIDDAGGGGTENNNSDASLLSSLSLLSSFPMDSMIVHCLNMDTSGIVIFAWDRASMWMWRACGCCTVHSRIGLVLAQIRHTRLSSRGGWTSSNGWTVRDKQGGGAARAMR